jgi:hypothetical protein
MHSRSVRDCDAARRRILDGLVFKTHSHLKGCADCRRALADFQFIAKLLTDPAGFTQPRGGWRPFERRLCAAVAAALELHRT